ncbi:MAG: hypothetical protein RSA27_08590, partial [Oscillospiraceae bacterium]
MIMNYEYYGKSLSINEKEIELVLGKYTYKGLSAYWVDDKDIKRTIYDYEITHVKDEMKTDVYGEHLSVCIGLKDFYTCVEWQINLYSDFVGFRLLIEGTDVTVKCLCPIYCLLAPWEEDSRVLKVPFDNDNWVRFASNNIKEAGLSYGVSAVYNEETRNGVIIGATEHDTWKVGVELNEHVHVYTGVTDVRETLPHGMVHRSLIKSPLVVMIPSDDWRDGMERFGKLCGEYRP